MKTERFTIQQAKEMDLVEFLASLGMAPAKITRDDYWYICPFHGERTASFKISRKLNRWFHFGIGVGGDLIDFGIRYYECTISQFLNLLAAGPVPIARHIPPTDTGTVKEITVLNSRPLSSSALLNYLRKRKILISVAKRHCVEIDYSLYERTYFAIGFANRSGGYEIRNAYSKLSASPKDITSILSGNSVAILIEGFMDFLSLVTAANLEADYFILNSTAFLTRTLPLLQSYTTKLLFLDNDPTGDRCTTQAIASGPGFQDCRYLYSQFHDPNDWLIAQPYGKATLPKIL
ncbi:toprim domain-containing protein [Pedobacter frigoris]|uniref:toprim domain-containing protein n=1 Tax=Pedobacter frigoris TaxID=2571272 RepID=UPI00292E8827|nr:toprim domain-containing protein [Pedobacter frigoris]